MVGVDQLGFADVQAERADIIFADEIIERTLVFGMDREKFIELDEMERPHVGFAFRIEADFRRYALLRFPLPVFEVMLDPLMKNSGVLPVEGPYASRIPATPFQKPECGQLSQSDVIVHHQYFDPFMLFVHAGRRKQLFKIFFDPADGLSQNGDPFYCDESRTISYPAFSVTPLTGGWFLRPFFQSAGLTMEG